MRRNRRVAWGYFVWQSEDWGKLLGDVPSATAILDRFLHHSEVIQITGKSYRLATREKTPKDTKALTGSAADENPSK